MYCNISRIVSASQWDDVFCFCGNCVELFSKLLSSATITTQWPRRWATVSWIRASLLPIAVSVRWKFVFIWVLLCVPNFSKASMKSNTKSRGLRNWVCVSSWTIWIPQLECFSQSILLFRYSRTFHLPHRIAQSPKWPCCWRVFGCLYEGYQSSQFCQRVFNEADKRFRGEYA